MGGVLRKCESIQEEVQDNSLACILLHNICIEWQETLSRHLNATINLAANQRRPRDVIRHLLNVTNCQLIRDNFCQANRIRDVLTKKLSREKQGLRT